jgi:hypothetical protein
VKTRNRNLCILVILLVLFWNYGNISLLILSNMQSREKTVNYDGVEPEKRLGEIAAVAFDSACSQKTNIMDAKYISFSADKAGKLSNEEISMLLRSLKKYNKRVIYAPLSSLKLMGLYNYFKRGIGGAFLYHIGSIKKVSNEKVEVEITCYQSIYNAQGYKCILIFKDGKWQMESIASTWTV